ncbi:MAG TPA: hypothetical protein VMH36_04015 [Alphaproteobacteria bacterium]|nr:hypothetical protein [Alphaproteobacteria bacterium]
MAIDSLSVTRLRALALKARDSAHQSAVPDVRRQYEDIARHYEQLIETVVRAAATRNRGAI